MPHMKLKSLCVGICFLVCAAATPLDDYVWLSDEHYGWTDFGEEHVISGKNLAGNSSWLVNWLRYLILT